MSFAFSGDFHEGDIVQCQRCAKNVRVKFYDRDTVVIVSTHEQQTLAMRCQYCGYVMCDSCAHPAENLFPICPSCQREWGPYYFTHDVKVPSLAKEIVGGDARVVSKLEVLPEPEIKDIPLAPMDTLAAGEIDILREELDRKHRNLLRTGLTILLILLLVGGVVLVAFGGGGSWFRKGLDLLSARPTRVPTSAVLQNSSSGRLTPTPTATATIINTPTFQKPSATPSLLIGASPIQATGASPSPTRRTPTQTATLIPTETNTSLPTTAPNESGQDDCVPALSVTLDDVGKTLCVIGSVVYTTQKSNAFSIYFSEEEGHFRIIVYDRVPKGIEKGVCVRVTGEIKVLLNSPVIAPAYKDVIDICSQ